MRVCLCAVLDAHTNFSVMVDRVASRFGKAEEASPDSGRERERERLGEISGRLSRFTERSTIFDIYTVGRLLHEFELHSYAREKCFIFPEEWYTP